MECPVVAVVAAAVAVAAAAAAETAAAAAAAAAAAETVAEGEGARRILLRHYRHPGGGVGPDAPQTGPSSAASQHAWQRRQPLWVV